MRYGNISSPGSLNQGMKIIQRARKQPVRGFTLIEILIVIAVIAIIAGVVLVALNPLQRFQDSRNSRRWSDINTIMSALKMYQLDNGGAYPASVQAITPDTAYVIGNGNGCGIGCENPTVAPSADCVDLSALVTGGKLGAMPYDPNMEGASADLTGYYLIQNANGSLTIGACAEEKGSKEEVEPIVLTR
jgi:prepilin-type N-terminal cleavage/methylation domain-containing protein